MKNNLTVKAYVRAIMLKRAFIVIIGLSVFLQSLHQFVLTAHYVLQSTQQKLENCINKNRPQADCKGKCQLARKLKSGAEKSEPTNLKNANISELFSESTPQFSCLKNGQCLSHTDSFAESFPTTYPEQRLKPPGIL